MKADQERVRNLLTDTVTLLCKNGLQYQTELRVQGVLGITLDNNDVFIVHINEKFGGDIGGAISIRNEEGDAAKTLLGSTRIDSRKSHDVGRFDTPIAVNSTTGEVVHRRRRRSRESSTSPALPTNNSQQHLLQRPIKRLMPSSNEGSSGVGKNRSLLNSSGSNSAGPATPSSEEVVDVKVKMEDYDDVIIVGHKHNNRTETSIASQDVSHAANESAIMQDSYPNLSLSDIQGSYQPFGEVLGVSNSSTNSGVDGTAPPPIKRRATSGSTQDSFGGSSEMGPDGSGPFITGIMRNETLSGDVAPQTTSAAAWDPSQMPDFGSLTAQDSQMILDSTPGCSTWDTTQQSQASAVATASAHTIQNISDQSSESVCFHFLLSCVCLCVQKLECKFFQIFLLKFCKLKSCLQMNPIKLHKVKLFDQVFCPLKFFPFLKPFL